MSKQTTKKAPDVNTSPPEEGIVIEEQVKESYEYVEIPINEVLRGLGDMLQTYAKISMQAAGIAKAVAEMQRGFVENIQKAVKDASKFGDLSLVIYRSFGTELTNQNHIGSSDKSTLANTEAQETRVYIQPTTPYIPSLTFPLTRRKKQFPITAVEIVGKGFTLHGEYISGITTDSKQGKVFRVFIRRDLVGNVDDKLLYEAAGVPIGRYDLFGPVLQGLKERLLLGNKIEMNLERYRGIKRYRLKGITKRIRLPKRKKKTVLTTKIN